MNLKLEDFLYDLPDDRIAKHPPKERSGSKLLFYQQGEISHHEFKDIDGLIPENSLLVFNDTKVIPARIILHKESGARIEIFLLEPLKPSNVHEEVMNSRQECTWKCMIGNAKKWKNETALHLASLSLQAIRRGDDEVTFKWNSDLTFSDLLTEIGKIPLPPYINREVEADDQDRYQTVYSKMKGAVAAPTAGLHFTNEIIDGIQAKGIKTDYLTLHVSAGTFQPIKSEKIADHPMHSEQIWISRQNIENLMAASKIIAVGTTSMRTMESLYWFGVKLLQGKKEFFIHKQDPYSFIPIERNQALEAVLSHLDELELERIGGQTEIFIYPGYSFQICDGLVTNYHLPGSTLILLVASFIGDNWKKVYKSALENNYRFLSYGDSSFLLR
ncbi:MAG: S-adenosylmethionine:tRNA ribosyltransferase-isomerase [Ekhidna sp.]|uniref:S-adenosylmethionine:tRNA ribosyltransferase-isomerase n=1 Tax=Ekhidna sp. TaxID=2608089 RepID=UPI0032ED5491